MAAPSTYVKSFTSGSLALADGTGSPVTHTATLDRGDTVIGPLMSQLNETHAIEARGRFKTLVRGKRIYPTIKLSAWYSSTDEDATAPSSLLEMMTATGGYVANVSTLGAGRPYTTGATLTIEGTNFSDTADEVWTFTKVEWVIDSISEAEDGNFFSATGTIYGSVVVTNGTNTVTFAEVS